MKKSIIINILCFSFLLSFQSANAVDIIMSPNCFSNDESVIKEHCFGFMKELFQESELWVILGLPIFLLSEKPQDAISSAQLTEMGYNADEIADFAKDMNMLRKNVTEKRQQFSSASEAKAWMRTLPLAPITREVMRLQ